MTVELNNTFVLPDITDDTLIQITPNVAFHWLHNGVAYEVIAESSQRKDVDAYIDANLAAINQWDKQQPFYSIQNISNANVSVTPYFKSRLDEVADVMKAQEIKGVSMIVMNNNFTGQLMKMLSRFFVSRVNNTVRQEWFTDITKAHEALEAHLLER